MHSSQRRPNSSGTRAAAQKWAIAKVLPQTQKGVLMALARSYSPRWGRCERTQKQIAEELGLSRETVNRTLAKLEAQDIISICKLQIAKKKGAMGPKLLQIGRISILTIMDILQVKPCDSGSHGTV